MKRVPILSFFSGGGFLDIGFEKAKFSVVWANEFNSEFAEMYSYGIKTWDTHRNRKPPKMALGESLEDVSAKRILKEAFDNKPPRLFGIIGGPPCPDFSTGGKNKGRYGKHGRLTGLYIERIKELKPTFFVLENVPGLIKTKAHREYLEELLAGVELIGYRVDSAILNALEFGCPQDRQRLFVVGFKESYLLEKLETKVSKGQRKWFYWPTPKYPNAKAAFNWPTKDSFGERPHKPKNIPRELMVGTFLNGKNTPLRKPNGKEIFHAYSNKFSEIAEGDTGRKSFKRLHRYRFSPTVCYGNNEVHLHPWEKRRLSVREALRIQGVPDSYILPKDIPLTAKFKMIGNGVPVPLAYEVAKAVHKMIV